MKLYKKRKQLNDVNYRRKVVKENKSCCCFKLETPKINGGPKNKENGHKSIVKECNGNHLLLNNGIHKQELKEEDELTALKNDEAKISFY